MKKTFIILLVIFSGLLYACDSATFNFNYDNMIERVISIELINYNNNTSNIIEIKNDTHFIFFRREGCFK